MPPPAPALADDATSAPALPHGDGGGDSDIISGYPVATPGVGTGNDSPGGSGWGLTAALGDGASGRATTATAATGGDASDAWGAWPGPNTSVSGVPTVSRAAAGMNDSTDSLGLSGADGDGGDGSGSGAMAMLFGWEDPVNDASDGDGGGGGDAS